MEKNKTEETKIDCRSDFKTASELAYIFEFN